jgi:ell wall binding domain 2 (CWB2)
MHGHSSRLPLAALTLLLAVLLSGCGKTGAPSSGAQGPSHTLSAITRQGAVSVATSNTTRLGGADAVTDAAAVARTVYPGLTAATRPQAVVLVDEHNWSGALAASVLASAPLGAPIIYSDGDTLPEVSSETLQALHPLGASALGGVQVIRIGTTAPVPTGYVVRSLPASEAAATAVAVEALAHSASGEDAVHRVIVVATNAPPSLAMPAAGLAAESGVPILLVAPGRVPQATAKALLELHRPSIYVVDPSAVDASVTAELHRLGRVVTIAASPAEGTGAAANALAVARFTHGTFGWGVKEPGHGLVFASVSRPLDAPAAALLSATGDYAPLLLLEGAGAIPPVLAKYLGDIKPAYTAKVPAVKGVYNHGWLIGDERVISAITQAEIDSLLEISPRPEASEDQSEEEQTFSQAE